MSRLSGKLSALPGSIGVFPGLGGELRWWGSVCLRCVAVLCYVVRAACVEPRPLRRRIGVSWGRSGTMFSQI